MKDILYLLSIFFVMALSGCEAVFTQQPIGEEVVTLDQATWQGTWMGDEVVLLTTVLDGEKGLLQAAWVERGAGGAKFESVIGTVRRTGELMFLSMEHETSEESGDGAELQQPSSEDDPETPEYFWARIENDGRRTILWWPDVEQIRLAIEDGRLPGTVKQDKDVVLKTLETSHLELISTPASNLLQWSQPVTFLRIGD